jgi:hypothetical protein
MAFYQSITSHGHHDLGDGSGIDSGSSGLEQRLLFLLFHLFGWIRQKTPK